MLSKLKCRGFRASSLSTYDFTTLYTRLPHNLNKEKLLDLIEWTFKRALKNYGSLYFACNDKKAFFHFPCRKSVYTLVAMPYPISWIILILDVVPSFTDKLLEFRWVQTAHRTKLIYFDTATNSKRFHGFS